MIQGKEGKGMQKVKIFKSYVNETRDTTSIESSLNSFVRDKKIISMNQSVVAKPGTEGTNAIYFMVVTVIYED